MKKAMILASTFLTAAGFAGLSPAFAQQPSWVVTKNGVDFDLRSSGRQLADEIIESGGAGLIVADEVSSVPGVALVPQVQLRGGNVQTNNGALDNIQVFAGFRPFIEFTQSETSVSSFVRNKTTKLQDIVAGFNNSADQPLVAVTGGLQFVHRFFSGFATSNDSGKTWASGSIPPAPGSIFTFGDPSVDHDRLGNFYYAGLGANAAGQSTIQVNKSTDGGRTWSAASIVQQDNGGDKEWIAVGKDPTVPSRDNVYVSWTSFQASGAQLRFSRSIDGGTTWQTQTIFAPLADANPVNPQNSLQFSNPYVDPSNGDLYIPFLHFSNSDQDYIRMFKSTDGGQTFNLVTFNDPTAPNTTSLTVTQPGTLIDCGSGGGFRLAIHAGTNLGGRFGLPQYQQASRLVLQPALAARNGVVYLAWSNSTSTTFGDPAGGSDILFTRSNNGGATWSAPVKANPTVAGDARRVLPALSIDTDPNDVHIAYYTQHADGTVDVDLANSHDRGATFPNNRNVRVTSQATTLAPTNVRLAPGTNPANTTNYDRNVRACYNLGEYLSVRAENGSVHVLWADGRNSVTHPVNTLDPLSGVTHAQQDVFYQKVKAQ